MWKIYQRTPRRFKVVVDWTFTDQIDYQWCNYDKLDETIQKFVDKYKDKDHYEIHVYEIFNIDWEGREV